MQNIKKLKILMGCSIYLYIIFSFMVLDAWLRVVTRWLGYYSIYEVAPNLFTGCWSVLLVIIVMSISKKMLRRIVYAIFYYFWMVYAIVQYGAYLILGKFLFLSDFMYAGEGTDYVSYILDFLDVQFILQIVVLIMIGVIGIKIVSSDYTKQFKHKYVLSLGTGIICVGLIGVIPTLYGEVESSWDNFTSPAYEYEQFSNSGFDLELTGMYQYAARDIYLKIEKANKNYVSTYEEIDLYFETKSTHSDNAMTGIFEEKNVIFVMMESMDDWLITEEDTPTLYYMMTNGINFEEFYTPDYSNGYTFNTEFAFNTGIYPFSNGNVAYSLTKNQFSNSMANIFAEAGYSVNSYHEGQSTFYNRGNMHEAWGYENYYSYADYEESLLVIMDDSFLVECDELYEELIKESPFMSFVITFSPHLPYTEDDELAQYALEKYPEYSEGEVTESCILRAKAKLTDDMFTKLLQRLEDDEMLDNTVIVAFADHYAYGISDEEFLQQVSEEAGHSILENTPAFIYYSGLEEAMQIDKVMQTIDLFPTIANLFGLEVPKEIIGSDVFDENYTGYAIFPNNTWLTNEAYIYNGSVVWNNGMSEEEILEMNQFVQKTYRVNDDILESDYYRYHGSN